MKRSLGQTIITVLAILVVVLVFFLVFDVAGARAHDIYHELTKNTDCICGTNRLCEVVQVEVIPAAEAQRRQMQYRIQGWGKLMPAEGEGYWLPRSGEFIPAAHAMSSPDSRFHRCTYPINEYWDAQAGLWRVLPDNSTLDGKPVTRCFFAPVVGY